MPGRSIELYEEDVKFGPDQEKSIIALAFDEPQFFANIAQYLKPEHFTNAEAQYVYTRIIGYFETHGVVITRSLCKEIILQELSADDDFEPIVEILERRADPRDVPIIKEKLVDWAKDKAFAQLYSEEAISAYERGEYDAIRHIIDEAGKITDKVSDGFWFFKNIDSLFEEDTELKLTTGYPRLDAVINEGGPTKGDVFCWMAPTGVGKSIMLVNNAVNVIM
jgi:replicative DNA helicase